MVFYCFKKVGDVENEIFMTYRCGGTSAKNILSLFRKFRASSLNLIDEEYYDRSSNIKTDLIIIIVEGNP